VLCDSSRRSTAQNKQQSRQSSTFAASYIIYTDCVYDSILLDSNSTNNIPEEKLRILYISVESSLQFTISEGTCLTTISKMSAVEFKDKGNKHLQAKQYDEAIDAYTQAIALSPSDQVFYSNRSAAYLSKGDAANALVDAEKCVELKPDWPKGYSRKGAALHSLKNYESAIEAYEAGLRVDPNDAGCKSGIEEVRKVLSSGPKGGNPMGNLFSPQMLSKLAGHPKFGPKLADPTFQMKIKLFGQNPQMMMQDPEMMELLTAVLGVEGGQGDDEDDSGPHQSRPTPAPAAPPKAPEPDYNSMSSEDREEMARKKRAVEAKERGNNFYKSKQFAEALSAYDEAISIDPMNVMFLNNKAAVYIEMNEVDNALEACNKALEFSKEHRVSYEDKAKIYQRIAAAHSKAGRDDEAIEAYKKAQMENYDKAIERKMKNLELELKKKALAAYIDPEKGLAAKELGNAAFREGKFREAIPHYEEATKRDPTNAPYHNNLAAARLKVGDFMGAKASVEKALDIDRKYVKAWAKKGDIEVFMKGMPILIAVSIS
jgi:stress-induced-phosphoprotein 1